MHYRLTCLKTLGSWRAKLVPYQAMKIWTCEEEKLTSLILPYNNNKVTTTTKIKLPTIARRHYVLGVMMNDKTYL
jgi:hypothetical protein